MEAVQEKVMVPTTVQKPVTRKVARERIEYKPETHVKPVQIQTTTYKPELITENVEIRTPTMEKVVQKVQVPRRIARTVPVTEMKTIARTYTQRIPMSYVDPMVTSTIVSSYPIIGSSSVVTAGAVGADGSVSQAVDASKPATSSSDKGTEKGTEKGTGVDLKKPESTDSETLPSGKSKTEGDDGLSLGDPAGTKKDSNNKSPSAGKKIALPDE